MVISKMEVPHIGARQVYHLLVLGFYIYFDVFVLAKLISNVSKVDVLKDIYPVMLPQFATIWSQFVIQDYFVLSYLEDLLAFTPKDFVSSFKQTVSEHANNLLIFFVLPFNLAMCANFWVLFYIDPKYIDEYNVLFDYLDRPTNHAVHTYVIALILTEMFLTKRRYPASLTEVYPYVKMAKTFACYLTVVFSMKLFSPIWPYPYFQMMTAVQWPVFILTNLALLYACYAFGFFYNSLLWGKGDAETQEDSATEGEWKMSSWWSQLSRVVQVVQGR